MTVRLPIRFLRSAPLLVALAGCVSGGSVGGKQDSGNEVLGLTDAGPNAECASGQLKCGTNATCVDNPSKCVCNAGYQGDGQTCTDINECTVTYTDSDGGVHGACDPNATCKNTPGSYSCACNPGFVGDGQACTPVDLCATNNGGCATHAACSQANGVVACACETGYQGDGHTCTLEQLCQTVGLTNCDANATCTDLSSGGYLCTCKLGYQGDGVTCTDVNECANGTAMCGANMVCTNTPGSYSCDCAPGYQLNGTGSSAVCVDIDECTNGTATCAANATCVNYPGSYACQCPPGFTGNGQTCTAVDLCVVGGPRCGTNATCTSANGTFTCACNNGYSGDGQTCTDINECTNGTAMCDPNATCTNIAGSYTCACKNGYSGSGKTCMLIDECASNPCDPNATCVSGIGTFICTCNNGYSGNGITCADIDECTNGTDDCSADAVCTNTPGSYNCACSSGYQGDGVTCSNINECLLPSPPCNIGSRCVDTPGSYYCYCAPGEEGGASCHPLRKHVATGSLSGCRVASTGSTAGPLACWGTSTTGALGLGPSVSESIAAGQVAIPAHLPDSNWEVVSTSSTHSCGIRSDHTLYCWGAPDNSGNTTSAPTQVGSASDWADISVGRSFTCGIRVGGTLYCWGLNTDGQVGDSTTVSSYAPKIIGNSSTWESVAAGDHHACGINAGAMYCWGGDDAGQNGLTQATNQPTLVDATQHWATVRAGIRHTCATTDVNGLYCWGDNTFGELGNGSMSTPNDPGPQQVGNLLAWVAVATGASHTCAIQTGGTLWCWGDNTFGQLGTANTTSTTTPQQAGVGNNWIEISGGTSYTCGEQSTGAFYCWGSNDSARLGIRQDAAQFAPVQVSGSHTFSRISANGQTVCGILATDASLWCWGDNGSGQLGIGSTADQQLPVAVSNGVAGFTWADIAVGGNQGAVGSAGFTCGVGVDGSLWCWGDNNYGELGGSTTVTQSSNPVLVTPSTGWVAVTAGGTHACALQQDPSTMVQTLYCWGGNGSGQVGNGSTSPTATITAANIPGTQSNWALVAAGDAHTCAVDLNGALACWGSNSYGQAAGNNSQPVTAPQTVAVPGIPGWSSLFLGTSMSCAVATTSSNDLYCWGLNSVGQLGLGNTTAQGRPTLVQSPDPTMPFSWSTDPHAGAASDTHVCAIQADDTMWCWGENFSGEFGNNAVPTRPPMAVTSPAPGPATGVWSGVAVGHEITCGLQSGSNAASCFGLNQLGGLGNGLAWYMAPVQQP